VFLVDEIGGAFLILKDFLNGRFWACNSEIATAASSPIPPDSLQI
jgi:hypothetical protein